jgi:hypothetical protein
MGCGASKPKPETFEEKLERMGRQLAEDADAPYGLAAPAPQPATQQRRLQPPPATLLSRLESVDDFQPLPSTHRADGAMKPRRTSAPTVIVEGRADDSEKKPRRRKSSSSSKLTTPSGKLDRDRLRQRVAERAEEGSDPGRRRRKSLQEPGMRRRSLQEPGTRRRSLQGSEPRRRRSSVKDEGTGKSNADVLQAVTQLRRASAEGADEGRRRRQSASDMVADEAESIVSEVRRRTSLPRTDSHKVRVAAKYQPKAGKLNPHALPGA